MVTPNGTNGINGFGGFDDERETLLHTALFKQVSSEEARELLPYLQHAEYDKGDFIFREGDTDHRMYLLEEGRVKLTRQSSDKRVQLLSIHAYGEVLGEIPVFDPHGGPRTASAVAMTNGTRVVWLEHDALFDWLDEHPRVDNLSHLTLPNKRGGKTGTMKYYHKHTNVLVMPYNNGKKQDLLLSG